MCVSWIFTYTHIIYAWHLSIYIYCVYISYTYVWYCTCTYICHLTHTPVVIFLWGIMINTLLSEPTYKAPLIFVLLHKVTCLLDSTKFNLLFLLPKLYWAQAKMNGRVLVVPLSVSWCVILINVFWTSYK